MTALDFASVDRLTGYQLGIFDLPCLECGPGRREPGNRTRKVLRIYRKEPDFATFNCSRCGIAGHVRRDDHGGAKRNTVSHFQPEANPAHGHDPGATDEATRIEAISAKALRIWAGADPADRDHPYLRAKGVRPHGDIRQSGERLILRMQHPAKVTGLQFIDGDGAKRFLTGSVLKASYTILGDPGRAARLLFCEGYATAASIFEATGLATIVCFAATNLKPVAQTLRRYPLTPAFVFAADADEIGSRAAEAAALAVGGTIMEPM